MKGDEIAIDRSIENENHVGERNRMYIEEICSKTGEEFNKVLNRIIAEHEEYKIFEELETCYTELRKDETAWKEHLAEREQLSPRNIKFPWKDK